MTDEEQAKRVEAALAGRVLPELCVDCEKTKTISACTRCKARVCSKCQTKHRQVHQNRHRVRCSGCMHMTQQRCRECKLPICSRCSFKHQTRTRHSNIGLGDGNFRPSIAFPDVNRLEEFEKYVAESPFVI